MEPTVTLCVATGRPSWSIPTDLFDAARPNPWLDDPLPVSESDPPEFTCVRKRFHHRADDQWGDYPFRLHNGTEILYHEYRAQGYPHGTVDGEPGDIWLDESDPMPSLYSRDVAKWVSWPGKDLGTLIPYPHLGGHYLWCRDAGPGWYTYSSISEDIKLSRAIHESDVLLAFLEREARAEFARSRRKRKARHARTKNSIGSSDAEDVPLDDEETNDIGEGSKKRQISYDSDPDPGSDFEPSPRKRTKTHGKQENSKANGLVKKLTSKSARLEKEIERLGDALTETQETLETFRETNNDLEERIARAARKKLAAKAAREQEKEKDSRDKDLLASEKKEISAANTLLSQERDSLRKSLDTSNNALMEIASRNVALIDQNKRLVDAESVSKSAQADLQMQVLRHTHENEELRRMLQERDAESAVQGEPLPVAVLAQLPGPIRQVVEYLNQQNSIAGNMRTEVAEGKQKLADAEERLETKTMEVLRAKAETASAQRDLADATKRLVDSEDNFKKATETAQNCQKQLHALNDALITVNHELAESKRKLEDAEGQVAANQKDVMELTAARQELSLKYDKEVERRLEAERRISDLQKAVREVPNMLQSLLG